MTTLFFVHGRLVLRKRACVFLGGILLSALTPQVSGQKVAGIGYVVSVKDRAQADQFYQQGFAAYQAGDYPQALSLIEQADRLKPDQPAGWNLRGMVFLHQKAYDKAQAAFARAVALDPGLWAAQFNLAEASFQQKNYARAQKGFERLLAQTDRFKSGNRWELVQYKVCLCCLLQGNAAEAGRRLAKLPIANGATPARFYAEAALAYQQKKADAAQKSVAAAQAAYPAQTNELFADSLVQVGWQSPALPPALTAANSASPLGNAALPPGVTLATSIPGQSPPPFYPVDPKVEAAVAEPLPLPDAGIHPIVGKVTLALQTQPGSLSPSATKAAPTPVVAVQKPPVPQATPDVELEHRDLLLVE